MKRFRFTLLLSSFALSTLASSNSIAHELTLTIDKIKNTKGVMMIALHNSEAGYATNKATFSSQKLAVTGETMTVNFGDVPAGNYAIKLFQDENENGALDTNLLGIPSEGYGFSNNGGAMGQPDFKDATFSVADKTLITIHLR